MVSLHAPAVQFIKPGLHAWRVIAWKSVLIAILSILEGKEVLNLGEGLKGLEGSIQKISLLRIPIVFVSKNGERSPEMLLFR